MLNWEWKSFLELTPKDLYEVLSLRQTVFIVEQRCAYLDADGLDFLGHHLLGWNEEGDQKSLIAYLRVLPPGARFPERSLGRVVTAPSMRGKGIGQELMRISLKKISDSFGSEPIRISAQAHLQRFYESFGFFSEGSEYLEDDIPHVEMVRVVVIGSLCENLTG